MSKTVSARWVEGEFGFSLDISQIPPECDMVLIQVMGQHQLKVVKTCMPHQVYRHDVAEMGGEVYITPFKSEDRVCIKLKQGDKYNA